VSWLDAVEFPCLGCSIGDSCNSGSGLSAALLLQQAFRGRALGARCTFCMDHPGVDCWTDLGVLYQPNLRRHQVTS